MSAHRSHRARASKRASRSPRLLRCEQLESRTVLAAISPVGSLYLLVYSPVGDIGVYGKTAASTPPAVAKAASASVNSAGCVTGTTTALSVLGSDVHGESSLVYEWTVTSAPGGGGARFSANGTNAAKNNTVTFNEAGVFGITVTIVDGTGLSVTSNVKVTVAQTLTGIRLYTGGTKVLVSPNTQLRVSGTSQTLTAVGVDQFGYAMAAQPSFTWAATSYPSGAKPLLTSASGLETVTFNKIGSYGVTASASGTNGSQISALANILVASQPTTFTISQVGGAAKVLGTSTQIIVGQFLNQFQNPLSETTALTWSTTILPAGAVAPQFTVSGSTTTVKFSAAGTYVLTAKQTDMAGNVVSESITVTVAQVLTGILVTPGTTSIPGGAAQQFNAQGFDQFQRAMATQPTITWNANGGTISSGGLFTAPSTAGAYSVTAGNGSIAGAAKVTVTAPSPSPSPSPTPGGLKDPVLASLVQKLDADGSLGRADMIQILTSVGASGTVSATDLSDLQTILTDAAQYNMPSYVQVLAADVVDGNTANADYQGAALGNLAAGSSAAQLDKLIDKWFLGTDLPALTSSALTYTTVSGSLFPTTPSNKDEFQGELGDCYFISSLGTIADSNPTAIENMFINNGDGTYTVRFYNGGTADYVTVNSSLPTYYGTLVYADCGFNASNSTNSLWIPLAEKAYAQWNETGNEGRDGTNTYAGIEGGWMADVDAQVLGHNAASYSVTASSEQAMINALATNEAVTIGTDGSNNSGDTLPGGLYGSHAYAVLSYNASAGVFTLYNPWGCDQPGTLSWSQLESTCEGFVVATTTGSVPISGANLHAPVSEASTSPSTATNLAANYSAWSTRPANETGATTGPAVMGNTSENHPATIPTDRSALHDSIAETPNRPVAAGVDAVLASEDVGRFLVA
ncbi:MAG: C2 family cysteine protease [Thermoguttaceae bacterium]